VLKYELKPGLRVRCAAKTGLSFSRLAWKFSNPHYSSLPIPTRDEILNSPVQEYGPHHGATSSFTAGYTNQRPPSPIMDDPSEELERELASTHIGNHK